MEETLETKTITKNDIQERICDFYKKRFKNQKDYIEEINKIFDMVFSVNEEIDLIKVMSAILSIIIDDKNTSKTTKKEFRIEALKILTSHVAKYVDENKQSQLLLYFTEKIKKSSLSEELKIEAIEVVAGDINNVCESQQESWFGLLMTVIGYEIKGICNSLIEKVCKKTQNLEENLQKKAFSFMIQGLEQMIEKNEEYEETMERIINTIPNFNLEVLELKDIIGNICDQIVKCDKDSKIKMFKKLIEEIISLGEQTDKLKNKIYTDYAYAFKIIIDSVKEFKVDEQIEAIKELVEQINKIEKYNFRNYLIGFLVESVSHLSETNKSEAIIEIAKIDIADKTTKINRQFIKNFSKKAMELDFDLLKDIIDEIMSLEDKAKSINIIYEIASKIKKPVTKNEKDLVEEIFKQVKCLPEAYQAETVGNLFKRLFSDKYLTEDRMSIIIEEIFPLIKNLPSSQQINAIGNILIHFSKVKTENKECLLRIGKKLIDKANSLDQVNQIDLMTTIIGKVFEGTRFDNNSYYNEKAINEKIKNLAELINDKSKTEIEQFNILMGAIKSISELKGKLTSDIILLLAQNIQYLPQKDHQVLATEALIEVILSNSYLKEEIVFNKDNLLKKINNEIKKIRKIKNYDTHNPIMEFIAILILLEKHKNVTLKKPKNEDLIIDQKITRKKAIKNILETKENVSRLIMTIDFATCLPKEYLSCLVKIINNGINFLSDREIREILMKKIIKDIIPFSSETEVIKPIIEEICCMIENNQGELLTEIFEQVKTSNNIQEIIIEIIDNLRYLPKDQWNIILKEVVKEIEIDTIEKIVDGVKNVNREQQLKAMLVNISLIKNFKQDTNLAQDKDQIYFLKKIINSIKNLSEKHQIEAILSVTDFIKFLPSYEIRLDALMEIINSIKDLSKNCQIKITSSIIDFIKAQQADPIISKGDLCSLMKKLINEVDIISNKYNNENPELKEKLKNLVVFVNQMIIDALSTNQMIIDKKNHTRMIRSMSRQYEFPINELQGLQQIIDTSDDIKKIKTYFDYQEKFIDPINKKKEKDIKKLEKEIESRFSTIKFTIKALFILCKETRSLKPIFGNIFRMSEHKEKLKSKVEFIKSEYLKTEKENLSNRAEKRIEEEENIYQETIIEPVTSLLSISLDGISKEEDKQAKREKINEQAKKYVKINSKNEGKIDEKQVEM